MSLLRSANTREYARTLDQSRRVVRYISNHDVNIYEGTPRELFESNEGALAAFVVAAYMKSVPMIYNGQEIGYPARLEFFTRTPIDWSAEDAEMVAAHKQIIGFYHQSNAIRRGLLQDFSSVDVSAFSREYEEEKVLVIANLRDRPLSYTLPSGLVNTSWEDAFSGGTTQLNEEIALQPFEYLVLQQR